MPKWTKNGRGGGCRGAAPTRCGPFRSLSSCGPERRRSGQRTCGAEVQTEDVTPFADDGSMSDHPRLDARARPPTTESLVDPVARARLGVVSIATLRDAGVSDGRRAVALRRGGLVAIRRGVYRPNGVRLSPEAELRAACEACGPLAVASHRSALWLWGLLDQPARFEVTIPSPCRSRPPNVIVHRSTDLTDRYRFSRRSVSTTTPDRALIDGAAVLGHDDLARSVEQALIDRLVSVATLRTILDDLGRRGRRGAGALRGYLDRRALLDARPESHLEPLMARLCRDHRLGRVKFQGEIVLDGHRLRPDFQFPDALVVVEVDGLDAHRTRDAFDSDLTRQNLFIRHGWLVLRYTSTHLRRPGAVAREIAEVVGQRLGERSDEVIATRRARG